MCGRFTLTLPGELVAEAFDLEDAPGLAPRYNIAPGQGIVVVRGLPAKRKLQSLRWGLPGPDEESGGMLINARSETAATKPTFREALRSRRCLVPADGFYEWQRAGARRQPFHFRLHDGGLIAFAGLWEPAPRAAEDEGACVILTTEANAMVAPVHDRMPVIVRPEDWSRWLDPGFHDPAGLRYLFEPFPAFRMAAVRVGPAVNSVRNLGPECLEPPRQGSLFE